MKENVLRGAGEDYLEAMLILEDNNGKIKSIDVANYLGVSRPSVNKAVGILKELGFINQEPYGAITLTKEGRKRAAEIQGRHDTLNKFLVEILGVDPVVADEDACKMEHIISQETLNKLSEYLDDLIK